MTIKKITMGWTCILDERNKKHAKNMAKEPLGKLDFEDRNGNQRMILRRVLKSILEK